MLHLPECQLLQHTELEGACCGQIDEDALFHGRLAGVLKSSGLQLHDHVICYKVIPLLLLNMLMM